MHPVIGLFTFIIALGFGCIVGGILAFSDEWKDRRIMNSNGRYAVRANDGSYMRLDIKSEYPSRNYTFEWTTDLESAMVTCHEVCANYVAEFPPGSSRVVRIVRREV